MKNIMKNALSFALVLTLAFSIAFPVFASTTKMHSTENELQTLSEIVQRSLRNEFESARVSDTDNWIQLFDSNKTPYAFFVPLTDGHGAIVGYSVISDINGYNTVLATCEGLGASIQANNVLNAYANKSFDDIIIYAFPDVFIVDTDKSYGFISLTDGIIDVEDISKYETNVVDQLVNRATSYNIAEDDQTRAITTIYGSLAYWDYGGFVPVSVTAGVYYGGHQNWLTDEGISQFWADRSCGVTAAANVLHYMSQNVSGKSALYTKSNITKASFSAFQKQLYDYSMSPAIWGIPGLSTMKSNVEDWASYRNVSLSGVIDNSTWNTTNVRNYIATGLNSERPVLLQTWNSPISDLSWHWVTVTRIYKDGTDKILTSNWAGKSEYDFTTWCNGSSVYKSVLYFD